MGKHHFQKNDAGFIRAITANLAGEQNHLVVAFRNKIEISLICEDGTLEHNVETIVIEEDVLDIEHLREGSGALKDWLILALNNHTLRCIAFRSSIDQHFVVDEFLLEFHSKLYTVQPGSLQEDVQHHYFSVYTKQRDVLIFGQVGTGFYGWSAHPNFKAAMNPENVQKLKFFNKPLIYNIRDFTYDDKLDVVKWGIVENQAGDFAYTLIRKNSRNEYAFSNPLLIVNQNETYLRGGCDGALPEPLAPVIIKLPWCGSILFSQTGFFYRPSPFGYAARLVQTHEIIENSHIEFGGKAEGFYAYMKTPDRKWDVVAAEFLSDKNRMQSLLFESNGDVHMMTFNGPIIKKWTVERIGSILPDVIEITRLRDSVFFATFKCLKSMVFSVVGYKVVVLQHLTSTRNCWNGRFLKDILPTWKLYDYGKDQICASSSSGSTFFNKIFKDGKAAVIKKDPNLDDLLDITNVDGKPSLLKKQGVIDPVDSKIVQPLVSCTHGSFIGNQELAYISGNTLKINSFETVLSLEPSVLRAIRSNDKEFHAIVGGWDGTVEIITEKSQTSFKLFSPVTSAEILEIGQENDVDGMRLRDFIYIAGTESGEIKIYKQHPTPDSLSIFIGKGTVDFSNLFENKIIAYNSSNALQITLGVGTMICKAEYLDMLIPGGIGAIKFNELGKLVILNKTGTELHLIDPEEVSKYSTGACI